MESYLLAAVPSEEVNRVVNSLRSRYAKYTSYIIPPHITIYPPFFSGYKSEDELIKSLQAAFSGVIPVISTVSNINYFEGKNNVAYLEPDKETTMFLLSLVSRAVDCVKGNVTDAHEGYVLTPEEFHPHMTIAEKIPPDEFPAVKNELGAASIRLSFLVNSLQLFKQSDGSRYWEPNTIIKF